MIFKFEVEVEVERESGKFMSRDEISEVLTEAIEGGDPSEVYGGPDGDSVYSVISWSVNYIEEKKAAKK